MNLQKKGIIIDAEVFYKFVDENHEDSKPIHKYLMQKKTLQLVYGNDEKSSGEIKRNKNMVKQIAKLEKNLVAYQVDSKEKKKEIDDSNGFIKGVKLRSWTSHKKSDAHIIAIALVEKKARLLFSSEDKKGDNRLQRDFKNHEIIKPKGQIYKNKDHEHLFL